MLALQVLCVDWSPTDKNLLLSTDMGGNALLTDASTGFWPSNSLADTSQGTKSQIS
jgi:hypothetical protein